MKKTFSKEERLCSKREIDSLFRKGSSFLVYPFRVVYFLGCEEKALPKVLVSVSKKRMKKAVDRNKIKRKTREAYRLSKHLLRDDKQERINIYLALQFIASEDFPFSVFEKSVQKALTKIKDEGDKQSME